MKKCILFTLFLVSFSLSSWGEIQLSIAAQSGKAEAFKLIGKTSAQQLVVTAKSSNKFIDVSHKVTYSIKPAGLVKCNSHGLVKPLKNGKGIITVSLKGSKATSIPFEVSSMDKEIPADFANEVIPILTRSSCNS